jgi:hypothetical protein
VQRGKHEGGGGAVCCQAAQQAAVDIPSKGWLGGEPSLGWKGVLQDATLDLVCV